MDPAATTLPLRDMSQDSKLRVIEELLDNLCRSPRGVPSPKLHAEVLAARAERVKKRDAEGDLQRGREFYHRQEPDVGSVRQRLHLGVGGASVPRQRLLIVRSRSFRDARRHNQAVHVTGKRKTARSKGQSTDRAGFAGFALPDVIARSREETEPWLKISSGCPLARIWRIGSGRAEKAPSGGPAFSRHNRSYSKTSWCFAITFMQFVVFSSGKLRFVL